ncbi:MAG TPA: energy transducer TonB [Opitutaceae bacterium]|nr:energy transducer TonB [Opitutaceae bacterium]
MSPRLPRFPRLISRFSLAASLLGLMGSITSLHAQHALCVVDGGKLDVVCRASGATPFVQKDGKLVGMEHSEMRLEPIPEYAPALVTIERRSLAKGTRAVSDTGPLYDTVLVNSGRFVFNADFKAARSLEDVVLLVVLTDDRNPDMFVVWGIGDMDANATNHVSIDEITSFKLLGVHLKHIYMFSEGREVFTSRIPASERSRALEAMIARRITLERDAPPHPLYVENPIYPPKLRPRVKGQAVVVCRVDRRGKVSDPTVASATNPAFGSAALEAIRKWRFVPKVEGGVAVDSKVNLPFEFSPPSAW